MRQLFAPWEIFHAFLSSADFFQNQFFRKILSGMPSVCQTVWIQVKPDSLSGLIWVQFVCKSYQLTTLGDNEFNAKISCTGIIYRIEYLLFPQWAPTGHTTYYQ